MAEPTAQGSVEIAAPPELVYDLVSDVTGVPEWAAEVDRCQWLGDADGPAVGAKFRGVNRHKKRVWAMSCVVTAADRGKRFAFKVHLGGVPTALWRYDIEPTDGGCRVTESTRRLTPRIVTNTVNRALGIPDRDAHNQANIDKTLARLKEHAEAKASECA